MTGLAVSLAFRNLGRHRWRTLLVGLAIAIGAASVVLHVSLVDGLRRQMTHNLVVSQYGDIAISPVPEQLIRDPARVMKSIADFVPGVRMEQSLSTLGMAFGEETSTSRIALWGSGPVPEGGPARIRTAEHAGIRFQAGTVLLGASIAERLGVQAGDTVTLSVLDQVGDLDASVFEVAAILEKGAPWQDYFAYLALEDLQSLMGIGNAVSLIKLYLPHGIRGADSMALRLRNHLQNDQEPVEVATYKEKGGLYMGIITAARIQAAMINIVLLFAVAFSVAGAQLLAIHERQREFGTMVALGTPRSAIRTMILTEGAVLAILAGTMGAVLGAGVALALGRTGIGMSAEAFAWMVGGPRIVPVVDGLSVLWILLELIVVVTLAGLFPASRAARMLPVTALQRAT